MKLREVNSERNSSVFANLRELHLKVSKNAKFSRINPETIKIFACFTFCCFDNITDNRFNFQNKIQN